MSYLDLRVQQVLSEKRWKVVPDIVARNSRPYDGLVVTLVPKVTLKES
jgi:hypothetical protein